MLEMLSIVTFQFLFLISAFAHALTRDLSSLVFRVQLLSYRVHQVLQLLLFQARILSWYDDQLIFIHFVVHYFFLIFLVEIIIWSL